MSILRSVSSFVPVRPPLLVLPPCFSSLLLFSFGYDPKVHVCSSHSIKFQPSPTCALRFPITATNASDQETVYGFEFEEIVEKDWSFLEFDDMNTDTEHMQKIDRIISAGNIKETSKVLVSIGSAAFVDRIVSSSPCEQLIVAHDALLVLASIKERHEKVRCWQGEVIDLPEIWTAFDVVYLYFLPGLSFELDQLLAALAKRCLPGARVVISHPQGKKVAKKQKQRYPDVVLSNLPDKLTLESTAANHSLRVLEFVDQPGFYLAVMRFNED